jgi:hypothetical protein
MIGPVTSDDFFNLLKSKNINHVDVNVEFLNEMEIGGKVMFGHSKASTKKISEDIIPEFVRFCGGLIKQNIIGAVGTTTTWTSCNFDVKVIRIDRFDIVIQIDTIDINDCSGDPI